MGIIHFSRVKKSDAQIKIGKRIVELRTKKGWSQSDLARALGKDRQNVERIENGRMNPSFYTLIEFAEALEITVSKLVEGI
jgi:transcriptional regulator with XRE-family HTH domain